MDTSGLITILVLVVFIALVVIWRKTKGKRGEKQVAVLLKLLPSEYRVINDLMVKNGGYTSQSDHVVVSPYGIFVIETKYYKGWILGGENSEYWTKNVYGKKYELRNPIWQNEGHIKALRRALADKGSLPFVNIVAFSSQARIKVRTDKPVIYWYQIVPYICKYKERQLTDEQVETIYHTLTSANVTDRESRKEHVHEVRRNQARRNYNVANGRCPLCGGNLVLRQGKYGAFYGCSNYPKCTYTRPA